MPTSVAARLHLCRRVAGHHSCARRQQASARLPWSPLCPTVRSCANPSPTGPQAFKTISAFSPISNPCNAPWGVKAFTGTPGAQRTGARSASRVLAAVSPSLHPS